MKKIKMSVLGIGPVYVLSCLTVTVLSIYLSEKGSLDSGKISNFRLIMIFFGVLSILLGVTLWIQTVFLQKMVKAIKDNILLTKGVYAGVRNPIYSAFFFVFTGMLLIEANLWLLILPIVFWLYMTILLKLTEEKWLKEAFGQEYIEYCARVNRVFPWFPKK